MIYNKVIDLIEEAVFAQEYFAFLCGNPSDVNLQFDNAVAFPLGFLYYPSGSVTLNGAYADFDSFNITLELTDLDEINNTSEVSKTEIIARMYEVAKNVVGYLNQRNQGFDLFVIENISITPLARVTTNAQITSGVRLDFTFTPEPEFSTCFI